MKNIKLIHVFLLDGIKGSKISIEGDVNKSGRNLLIRCVNCIREKSLFASDNAMQADGLGKFFRDLGKKSVKTIERLATN